MEMSGAVLCQSIAGWLLSGEAPARERYGSVLRLLLLLILAQFTAMVVWWRLIGRREAEDDRDALEYGLVPTGESEVEGDNGVRVLQVKATVKGSRSVAETVRGARSLRAAAAFVVSSWVSFGVGLLR